MAIEIVIGIPHLNQGPILAAARRLNLPVLVSANALSRWRRIDGVREWTGWRTAHLANAAGLASLDLDSAGFVAMARYRGFPWTIEAYFALARAFPFRRIASLDYCTEQEIAANREEVLDRVSRTIRTNRECALRAADVGLTTSFMPVLQGRRPEDYERCADAIASLIRPGTVVGIGSMCRRAVAGADGIIAVIEHLDRILPRGIRLHAFGVKGAALPYLKHFDGRITSIDSQAYGVAARRDAHRRHIRKTDALVAAHLESWVRRQHQYLAAPGRSSAPSAKIASEVVPAGAWEAAIGRARAEIRALIESGDLDHDEIVDGWIEGWAADLLTEIPARASSPS
jgi:hypothetical protein